MSLVDALHQVFTELKNSDISPDYLGDLELGYIQAFVHDKTGFNLEDATIQRLWVNYNRLLRATPINPPAAQRAEADFWGAP